MRNPIGTILATQSTAGCPTVAGQWQIPMRLIKWLAALAIAGWPFLANADVFNFSYTFGSGDYVTGSLSGTQNGNFIEGVSNVSVSVNGHALAGSDLYQPYILQATCCFLLGTPVISFDANLNNFFFGNNGPLDGVITTDYFYMVGVDMYNEHDGPLQGTVLQHASIVSSGYYSTDIMSVVT